MRPSRSAALATLLAATATTAHAEELRVPEDYPTIQAAVDAAVDGDVVSIAAGEYVEQRIGIDRSITLRGRTDALRTTLRGVPNEPIIRVDPKASGTVLIENISIRSWASSVDAAAVVTGADATTLRGCLFEDCLGSGGGVLRVDAPTFVQSCVFFNNQSAIGGAIFSGRSLTIEDSMFFGNRAVNPSGRDEGGAIHVTSAPALVRRSLFVGNQADIGGAICRSWNSSAALVESCSFAGNSSNWNCCIQCVDCDTADSSTYDSDCDQDGRPDLLQIVLAPSLDLDGDGVLDRCQCPADLVADGAVNGADVAVLLNFWGTDGAGYPGVDLDGDGIVGGADLATLLGAWGSCPE